MVDLGSVLPALAKHEPLPEPIRGLEDPWVHDPNALWSPSLIPPTPTPSGISPDANHDRFLRLASHDTSVAMAHALDSLDGGSNSPPQVGGRPIDEYTAFGISVHRQLSFISSSAEAGHDRDLTPGTFPLDELMATYMPSDDPSLFDGDSPFRTGEALGAPPMDFRLPGAHTDLHVFGIGATEFRSVAALRRRDDWDLWEPVVRQEINNAFKTS